MRWVIFGNAGAGKTALARALAAHTGLPLLELDPLVAPHGAAGVRAGLEAARARVEAFCAGSDGWIVEGAVGHLIQAALAWQPELVFLNPGPAACLHNSRQRSLEGRESTRQLPGRLQRVADYYRRDGDERSLCCHRAIFDGYDGPKIEFSQPPAALALQMKSALGTR